MSCFKKAALVAVALAALFHPRESLACACGCGLFQVSSNALYPQGSGGTASLEYNFINQTDNYNGGHNHDKRIATTYLTAGTQYMFDRSWGVSVRVPFADRKLTAKPHGFAEPHRFDLTGLGDVRITGLYTGFSPDMSTGVEFGLKLPTGRFSHDHVERESQIGTGSTDLLLGAYQRGRWGKSDYGWFAHGALEHAVLAQGDYRPGSEVNLALGTGHDPVEIGGGVKVAPMFQLISTYKMHDRGDEDTAANTGYARIVAAPGIEVSRGGARFYTDVGIPVATHVRGEQLTSHAYVKAVFSHDF